jgi:RNA recognition motif-containing protein
MGDIKPWMNELFIKNSFFYFGLIPKSIKLIKDKNLNNPLNYCFINFDSLEKANQALNKLKNKKIPNSNIKFKLNWANKNFDKFKSAYISNIPLEVKDSDLFNFFKKKYPSVIHATIIRENNGKKNYGFVYFTNDEEYNKCLSEMNGTIFFKSIIKVKERKKKTIEEKKTYDFGLNLNINNIKDIKSYYPKKKEKENLESNETNSSSEEETKIILKRKFSDNLCILESNDHPLINQNIQKCVNKMFNYYKHLNEISGMILYYSSNIDINNNSK